MSTYSEYLNFAKDIAKYAGEIMLKYFSKDNGEKYKGDKTIVTLADTEINSYLINRVKEKYPSHAVEVKTLLKMLHYSIYQHFTYSNFNCGANLRINKYFLNLEILTNSPQFYHLF